MRELTVRTIEPGEERAVCQLVRDVFDRCVAEDYDCHGIEEFFRFAGAFAMAQRVERGGLVLVAVSNGKLVGMLEFVSPDRIALLFVTLRRQGIANALLRETLSRLRNLSPAPSKLTVHASPQSVPIYERMGFHRAGSTTTEHGIVYVPMVMDL